MYVYIYIIEKKTYFKKKLRIILKLQKNEINQNQIIKKKKHFFNH